MIITFYDYNVSVYNASQGSSAPGQTPQRYAWAHSPQIQQIIIASYLEVLGRSAGPADIASSQLALTEGATLSDLLHGIAYSTECASVLNRMYEACLARPIDGTLATYQANLASGATKSIALIQSGIAHSPEEQGKINGIYLNTLGRPADSGGLSTYENALSNGTLANLAALQSIAAYSPEAQGDLSNIYLTVLGRPIDPSGLATYQNSLATGTSLAQVRSIAAYSAEAQTDITNASLAINGVAPDAPTLAMAQSSLAQLGTGSGIAAACGAILNSSAGQTNLFNDSQILSGQSFTAAQVSQEVTYIENAESATIGITWADVASGVTDAFINFISALNPISTAQAATLEGTPETQVQQIPLPAGEPVLFVGGFFDHATGGPVFAEYQSYVQNHSNAAYVTWDNSGGIKAFIDQYHGHAAIVAHSYGADTAATVVANGEGVDILVLLDPVSQTRPNLANLVAHTANLYDFNAVGGSSLERTNAIAGVGGAWGQSLATYPIHYQDVGLDHGQIGGSEFITRLIGQ